MSKVSRSVGKRGGRATIFYVNYSKIAYHAKLVLFVSLFKARIFYEVSIELEA